MLFYIFKSTISFSPSKKESVSNANYAWEIKPYTKLQVNLRERACSRYLHVGGFWDSLLGLIYLPDGLSHTWNLSDAMDLEIKVFLNNNYACNSYSCLLQLDCKSLIYTFPQIFPNCYFINLHIYFQIL